MERPDRVVPVSHGTGCWRIYSGFAGARFPCGGGKAHLPAGVANSLGLPAGGAAAAATAPGTSGTVVRNVPDAAPHIGHGHVRVCLPLVLDGSSAVGNLARLPARHRAAVPIRHRLEALDLPADDPGLKQHRRTRARD